MPCAAAIANNHQSRAAIPPTPGACSAGQRPGAGGSSVPVGQIASHNMVRQADQQAQAALSAGARPTGAKGRVRELLGPGGVACTQYGNDLRMRLGGTKGEGRICRQRRQQRGAPISYRPTCCRRHCLTTPNLGQVPENWTLIAPPCDETGPFTKHLRKSSWHP